MRKKQNIKGLGYLLLTLFLLVITIISGQDFLPAFAETSDYTSVIEDLRKDSNFNVAEYPEKANDYSIQVIQIAESTGGELFVYTYQPCQKSRYLVATEINMSLSESVDGTLPYKLTQLSTWGVFGKYKVNGFAVSSEAVRYYNITSIYRDFIKGIDAGTGNDNVKNGVAFKVGKCFKAVTESGTVNYDCRDIETVEIIKPYHDYLRYPNGFKFLSSSCDGHYIAFSTDKRIERLIEAEVSYQAQTILMNNPYGEAQEKTVKLTDIEEGSNAADGWFAKKYVWKRIEKVSDFIVNEDLTPEIKSVIEDKQWVFRFCETAYSVFKGTNGLGHFVSCTEISNVTVLRLKFSTDGVVYNLGAVSDKVTGDNKPGNIVSDDNRNWLDKIVDFFKDIWNKIKGLDWWQWLIFGVVAILGIGLIIAIVIFGVNFVLKIVFKVLWWLICLPFRGLKALFEKIGGE